MNTTYVLDGQQLAGNDEELQKALTGCPEICTIAHNETTREVRAFRRKEDFERWIRTEPFAAKHEETEELVRKAREYESRDHRQLLEHQRLVTERVREDLSELSSRLGVPLTARELLDIAHHGSAVLDPPILHSAILFDYSTQGAVTGVLFIGVPIPTFGGGNDRTSQLDVVGSVTTLYDRTWWRGDRQSFYGSGFFTMVNSPLNNRSASGVCV